MLAGTSPRRCSVRVGVTVTVSSSEAGSTVISIEPPDVDTFCVFSANPPARTTTVTSPAASVSMENRPSGPVVARCSAPDAARTMTAAPETTPPLESCTTPERDAASKRTNAAIIH